MPIVPLDYASPPRPQGPSSGQQSLRLGLISAGLMAVQLASRNYGLPCGLIPAWLLVGIWGIVTGIQNKDRTERVAAAIGILLSALAIIVGTGLLWWLWQSKWAD